MNNKEAKLIAARISNFCESLSPFQELEIKLEKAAEYQKQYKTGEISLEKFRELLKGLN